MLITFVSGFRKRLLRLFFVSANLLLAPGISIGKLVASVAAEDTAALIAGGGGGAAAEPSISIAAGLKKIVHSRFNCFQY